MKRPIKNRLPQAYKKLVFNLTLRFYMRLITNRLTKTKIKEFLEYQIIRILIIRFLFAYSSIDPVGIRAREIIRKYIKINYLKDIENK